MERNFDIGDRVVFREWDDMAGIYGHDKEGIDIIDDRQYFSKSMKYLCGTEATVERVYNTPSGAPRIVLCDAESDIQEWKFSPNMFDPVGNIDDTLVDESVFLEILNT